MNPSIRESAIATVLMLGLFATLMVGGFWLRHGYPIWMAF